MSDWITTGEAAEISGYNREYVRELIRLARINAAKKGNTWWVNHESLLIYLEQAKAQPDKRHGAKKTKIDESHV